MIDQSGLDWADWPWQRCKAVKEPNPSGHWGRCELKRHEETIDHALERGLDIPRWSTRWTWPWYDESRPKPVDDDKPPPYTFYEAA